ncbi:MAG TPA: trypsin-like peptidase domain-containing protein [Candidatus Paceibacterota bacterium]|nr:trypsin-like peptidase domain-containing protein [Candidatus Paceibacterota bacterium]
MKKLIIIAQKIKVFFNSLFKSAIFKAILISFITIIITLSIIGGLLWHYRIKIFNRLLAGYATEQQLLGIANNLNAKNNNEFAGLPQTATEQDTVVGAVKKAKPAVVSIIVSKEVPKYDVSYQQNGADPNDPFGGLFPGFFQTPIYTPNGTEKQEIGSGSGFIISSDGLIVTNNHVVADTGAIYEVLLNNGKKYTAKVLARDSVLDVALVKISATNLPYLDLADSDSLNVGQTVIAIGNALGEFTNTVSVGVVSGLSRSITAGDEFGQSERLGKVIQTDAAINPGNSGGPLLNLSGQVVGINVAVVQGSSNVGFSLPINSVKNVISSVEKTGKIIRPYLGIRYINVDADLKAKNNLAVDYGILVQRGQAATDLAVIPGSPADKAGIIENDIILEIDGQKIDQNNDFAAIIRNKKVGDVITLKVLSKGVEKTVALKLEQAPDNL